MHKAGDYSDFKIGEIYPDTLIRIMSNVYKGDDNRQYVDYTCTSCNSGIIYRGRVDRIRSGRTCRCVECGRRSKRPEGFTKDIWKNVETTKYTVNFNNLTSNHIGKIYNGWLINAFDHTTETYHGHSYYNCINIATGEVKIARLDNLQKRKNNNNNNNNIQIDLVNFNDIVSSLNYHSKGELNVAQWLSNNNIEFDTEYTFPNLRGEKGGLLRFDFKIRNKPILIEFQGEQHYKPIEFFGGEIRFAKQQLYDDLKRKYCKYYNYHLIEIPYNYNSLDNYLQILL